MIRRPPRSTLFPYTRSSDLKARQAQVDSYALARLALRADGKACRLSPTELLGDEHSDGAYAVLRFSSEEHTSELQSPGRMVCRLQLSTTKCTRSELSYDISS